MSRAIKIQTDCLAYYVQFNPMPNMKLSEEHGIIMNVYLIGKSRDIKPKYTIQLLGNTNEEHDHTLVDVEADCFRVLPCGLPEEVQQLLSFRHVRRD